MHSSWRYSLGKSFPQTLLLNFYIFSVIGRRGSRLPKIYKRFRKGVWGITLLQKGFPQLPRKGAAVNSDLFHYCFKEVKDIGIDFVLIELIQQLMAGIFIYFHFHVTVIKVQIIKDFEHAFAVIPHGVGRA